MAEKKRISEPNKDEKWEVAGSQIVCEKENKKGLSEKGHSEVLDNLLDKIANQIDEKGVVLIKAGSNEVVRNERGEVVERRDIPEKQEER